MRTFLAILAATVAATTGARAQPTADQLAAVAPPGLEADCSLTLEDSLRGRVSVRNREGRLVMSLRKAAGDLELALDPGEYLVTLHDGTAETMTSVALGPGLHAAIDASLMVPIGRLKLHPVRPPPVEEPIEPAPVEVAPVVVAPVEVAPVVVAPVEVAPVVVAPVVVAPVVVAPVVVAPVEAATEPAPVVAPATVVVPVVVPVEVPAPPVPADPPAHKADPVKTWVDLHLGLTPGTYLTFSPTIGVMPHGARLAVNGFGEVEALEGVQVGLVNHVTGDLRGVDGSAFVSWVGGDVKGLEASMLTVAGGSVTGAQFGLASYAGGQLTGAQISYVGNVVAGAVDPKGGPFAPPSRGAQVASVFNWVNGDLDGAQVASSVNVVWGKVRGAQISVLNVGGDVDGAQIGVLNIARKVRGTQVGVLNISEDVDGVPVGLLNLASNGRLAFQAFTSDFAPYNVGLKVGTSSVYTAFEVGFCCAADLVAAVDGSRGRWGVALGPGWHKPLGDFWVDVELVGRTREYRAPSGRRTNVDVMMTPRAQLGWNVWSRVSAFAGVGLNVVTARSTLPTGAWGPGFSWQGDRTRVDVWPSFTAGVEL